MKINLCTCTPVIHRRDDDEQSVYAIAHSPSCRWSRLTGRLHVEWIGGECRDGALCSAVFMHQWPGGYEAKLDDEAQREALVEFRREVEAVTVEWRRLGINWGGTTK